MEKAKVLIVEDEGIVAKDIQSILKNIGYSVPAIAASGEEALELADKVRPDVILMDIMLSGEMDGIETAGRIKEKHKIPIIYLTAYEDEEILERAKHTDPLGYILKPFDQRDLYTSLEMALYKNSMEKRLHESEERYRKLVDYSPEGIAVHYGNIITFINPAGAKLLGASYPKELVGRSILDFITEELQSAHDETQPGNSSRDRLLVETQFSRLDGRKINVEVASVPLPYNSGKAVQVIFRDITGRKKSHEALMKAFEELKTTQRALINSEKLAALGRITTGIAHQIRNPLANISASVQFCMGKFELDEKIKKHFDLMLRNVGNANRIIKEMLDFTSPKDIRLSRGNISTVVKQVIELVKPRCIEHGIKLSWSNGTAIPDTLIDEKKLAEAFMNFISNSVEAMSNGGSLSIDSHVKNGMLSVTFCDTGPGIPEEDRDKIFEPFFTTKDEGTGLGLSLAYQIIKAHKGEISIESCAGSGTAIHVELPFNTSKE